MNQKQVLLERLALATLLLNNLQSSYSQDAMVRLLPNHPHLVQCPLAAQAPVHAMYSLGERVTGFLFFLRKCPNWSECIHTWEIRQFWSYSMHGQVASQLSSGNAWSLQLLWKCNSPPQCPPSTVVRSMTGKMIPSPSNPPRTLNAGPSRLTWNLISRSCCSQTPKFAWVEEWPTDNGNPRRWWDSYLILIGTVFGFCCV